MRVHMYEVYDEPRNGKGDTYIVAAFTPDAARGTAEMIWNYLTPCERRQRHIFAEGFDFDSDHVPTNILEEYDLPKGFNPYAIPAETLVDVRVASGETVQEAHYDFVVEYPAES